MTPCDTKKFYDTEFEANVHAAKTSGFTGHEMVPYRCGTHWHITHADPKKSRGVGHRHWRCPRCKQITKRRNAYKHKCGNL